VSFVVQAFNAHRTDAGTISFHQLHAACGRRIRYEKHCPVHGLVDNDEIVSAYEFSPGKYVEVSNEELESMRTEKEKGLTLESFVRPEDIDPVYFDGRMYWLVPDGDDALEPFSVFLRALKNRERWGVGQFVFSGKEQVAVLRPHGDVLHLALLNYEAEMRPADEVSVDIPTISSVAKKVDLAERLIASWEVDDFDFSRFTDQYVERVQSLVEAKRKGRKIETPEPEEEAEVINLMEALEKSLGGGQGAKRGGRHRSRATSAKRRKRHAS
jgi:DNA end-binding protein Ku